MLNWIVWNRTVFMFNCVFVFDRNKWNHLTVSKKMSSDSLKNVIYKMCLEIMYLIYLYKKDLALNNLQGLMCHKTKSNKAKLPTHLWWQNSTWGQVYCWVTYDDSGKTVLFHWLGVEMNKYFNSSLKTRKRRLCSCCHKIFAAHWRINVDFFHIADGNLPKWLSFLFHHYHCVGRQ